MSSHRLVHRIGNRRGILGFTLIELLIAVAIVSILAAVSYPSYRSYVVRTHRNAAKACLAEYAQFMERYYTTNLTYVGAAPVLACSTESNQDDRYTFTASGQSVSAYTITAAPKGPQASSDSGCGSLGMNAAGTRTATGSKGVSYCW